MSRIDIDFCWSPLRWPRLVGWGLLVFACAFGGYVAWLDYVTRQSMALWSDDIAALQRAELSGKVKMTPEAEERLRAEFSAAKRLIDRLDLPWDALFASLELSANDRVALLAIEPDTERREVRLSVEAKDLSSMLDYVRVLEFAPALRNVRLLGHQVNTQDAQRPVRFTVEAGWVPLSPVPPQEEPPMMGGLS